MIGVFLSKASFRFDTDGWYCVTEGKIYFCVLLFPLKKLSTEPLLVNLISDSSFSAKLRGFTSVPQMSFLNFEMFSSKVTL